jgi:heptaprenyl diphosphate synthase
MQTSPWAGMPALQTELAALESLLKTEFPGGGFIENEAARIVLGGGKRLRPALTIASAHLGEYDRAKVLPVAAAIEALHAAALAHDDVVDGAETRRGMPTAHTLHGSHVAVYAGDYLLAKSLSLLSRGGVPHGELDRLAAAMKSMCAGEVAQYRGRFRVPGHREYLKRIMGKTGVLFAAACAAGGHAGGLCGRESARLWRFGLRLGAAFQMRDDLLDYTLEDSGKPAGRDLACGVVTLPAMLAAKDADFKGKLTAFLGKPHEKDVAALAEAVRRSGALERTKAALCNELNRCMETLGALPEGMGRDLLSWIVQTLY